MEMLEKILFALLCAGLLSISAYSCHKAPDYYHNSSIEQDVYWDTSFCCRW